MFKLKDGVKPTDLGFEKKDMDYVYYIKIERANRMLFKIYCGSPYIRCSKASYVCDEQLRLIYEWTKEDVIEWFDGR